MKLPSKALHSAGWNNGKTCFVIPPVKLCSLIAPAPTTYVCMYVALPPMLLRWFFGFCIWRYANSFAYPANTLHTRSKASFSFMPKSREHGRGDPGHGAGEERSGVECSWGITNDWWPRHAWLHFKFIYGGIYMVFGRERTRGLYRWHIAAAWHLGQLLQLLLLLLLFPFLISHLLFQLGLHGRRSSIKFN